MQQAKTKKRYISLPKNAVEVTIKALIKFGWLTLSQIGAILALSPAQDEYPPVEPHPERVRELVGKLARHGFVNVEKRNAINEGMALDAGRARNDVNLVWLSPKMRRKYGLPVRRPGFKKKYLRHRVYANWHLIHLAHAAGVDLWRHTVTEFEIVTKTIPIEKGAESAFLVNLGGVLAKKPDGFYSQDGGMTWKAIEVEPGRKNPKDLRQIALMNRALSVSGFRRQRVQNMTVVGLTVVHGYQASFAAITRTINKLPPNQQCIEADDPPPEVEHHFLRVERTRWGFREFRIAMDLEDARAINLTFWRKL